MIFLHGKSCPPKKSASDAQFIQAWFIIRGEGSIKDLCISVIRTFMFMYLNWKKSSLLEFVYKMI